MSGLRRVLAVVAALLVGLVITLYIVYGGGHHQGPGVVHPRPLKAALVMARQTREQTARERLAVPAKTPAKQILFGDLHVHTTFSTDAYARSMPLVNGEGVHPPADACDYARYCSSLDFFALTDHAEAMTPAHFRESKESIRQCNAVAGDPRNPDLVAFMGFEWSQVGATPETHYGHRNVVFRDPDDEHLPTRPIAAGGMVGQAMRGRAGVNVATILSVPWRDFSHREDYADFTRFQGELRGVPSCPSGLDVRQLPEDCRESADTPGELLAKLRQWGYAVLVIPHGMTWGFYTPPGYHFDKSLAPAQQDVELQRLMEVYSGHGNSEEFRTFHEIEHAPDGSPVCPAPTANYEPCCHRAGELIRSRCGNLDAAECEARVAKAKLDYLRAGVAGHLTVPGASVEDWKDCGQCRDCFVPAFNYRPGGSAQFALAATNLDDPAHPGKARFGFIASSDNHSARPGTGYKEFARHKLTETVGAKDKKWRDLLFGGNEATAELPRESDLDDVSRLPAFRRTEFERQSSFFLTGGLVAVHSEGRDRQSIWNALERKEVYGTSGERILLWFDLDNAPAGKVPMGGEAKMTVAPHFVVRAAGSFEQKPGCPDYGPDGLPPNRLSRLCLGECYHPGDKRRLITRIEVIRVRPRKTKDEDLGKLIEDPWRKFECPKDPAGCTVSFEDPAFLSEGREVVYYVRAIQEPTLAVNGRNLRCERDAQGNCKKLSPCYGDYRTSFDDDCLEPVEERAWSSPIYIEP
jgi:hypothetical protein